MGEYRAIYQNFQKKNIHNPKIHGGGPLATVHVAKVSRILRTQKPDLQEWRCRLNWQHSTLKRFKHSFELVQVSDTKKD